ncbi:MAG: DEAD/DEAH box helicase [Sporolactobacillus sp.]
MVVHLTEDMIKKAFSLAVFQRGYHYYTGGHVHNLYFDRGSDCFIGEIDGEETCTVRIHFTGNVFDCSCSCQAVSGLTSPCQHAAALLLELYEYAQTGRRVPNQRTTSLEEVAANDRIIHQTDSERQRREEALAGRLIDAYVQLQQEDQLNLAGAQRETLQVEWTLRLRDGWLMLSMRCGADRLYVVQSVQCFVRAVLRSQPYHFTDKFSFYPSEHDITPADRAVMELLDRQLTDDYYADVQHVYMGARSLTHQRQFFVAPILFTELLKRLRTCQLCFDDHQREPVRLTDQTDKVPFAFHLGERADGRYEVDLSDLCKANVLTHYGYILKGNALYRLSPAQKKLVEPLYVLLRQSGSASLLIGKRQIEPFLSTVAPELRQVGDLNIAEQVSARMTAHPLHAKVLVDREADDLSVQLEYHYGQTVVKPFEQGQDARKTGDQIVVRDAQKEQQIMELLESASLHVSGRRVYASGEEAIYSFLFVTLPQLDELADVLLTNPVRTLMLPEQNAPFAAIEVDAGHHWLDVHFQLDGIEEADIQQVLRALVEKKRYYRLPGGTFVPLEDHRFVPIRTLLAELPVSKGELERNQLHLPLYRGGQIAAILGETHAGVGFGKHFRRFLNRLTNPELIEFELPAALRAQLRDYQHYGYQWLKTLGHYGLGGVLADEMGLGKTVQSIAFLLSEKEEHPAGEPALIVTPASLIYNWKNELAKFAPGLQAAVVSGTVEDRQVQVRDGRRGDIWITSYQTLRQDIDAYGVQTFSTLILDEAQMIKNFNTKTAKSVRRIKARNRFALSGTPIENSINELWSIFQTILPGFFPGLTDFKKLTNEKLAQMIRPFLLRRLKKDVLAELPDKIETVQTSELTQGQKAIYMAYLRRIQQETREALAKDGFEKSRIKILTGLTRLRQICCHPALFVEAYDGQSGKLEQLRETLSDYMESGRRILVFSQFTSMLALIRQMLDEEGIAYFYLDGQTPSKTRIDLVDQFNEGASAVFLISLRAGNTGLNLTGADTVILYDLWWNPAVEDQAVGRAHRIGQRHVVQVVRLITEGTIEEKIYDLQQKKRDLIETVVESGDQALARLSEEDIKAILSL